MSLPLAVAQAAEQALVALAPEVLPSIVKILEQLGGPKVPPEVVPLLEKLVAQIAASPNPVEYAKRAVISTASAEASHALLEQLLGK